MNTKHWNIKCFEVRISIGSVFKWSVLALAIVMVLTSQIPNCWHYNVGNNQRRESSFHRTRIQVVTELTAEAELRGDAQPPFTGASVLQSQHAASLA